MTAIRIENLTERYGSRIGGEDVDRSIPAGSVYALGGPNGSGKSAIIDVLAGLVLPTSGSVEIFDRAVRTGAAEHSSGMVKPLGTAMALVLVLWLLTPVLASYTRFKAADVQ